MTSSRSTDTNLDGVIVDDTLLYNDPWLWKVNNWVVSDLTLGTNSDILQNDLNLNDDEDDDDDVIGFGLIGEEVFAS